MRRVIIFTIILLISVIVVNGQEKSPKSGSRDTHAENVKEPPPPSQQVISIVNHPSAQPQENRSQKHADSYFHHLLSPTVDFCLDYKIISINKTYLSDNVVSDI
jgi:hypothetical protein